jgi:hypothetical protein
VEKQEKNMIEYQYIHSYQVLMGILKSLSPKINTKSKISNKIPGKLKPILFDQGVLDEDSTRHFYSGPI